MAGNRPPEKYPVDEKTVAAIFAAEREALKGNSAPVPASQPVASIILGGQPGAGKSTTRIELIEELGVSGAVVIDSDDFRKPHPKIEALKRDDDKEYGSQTQKFAQAIGMERRKQPAISRPNQTELF